MSLNAPNAAVVTADKAFLPTGDGTKSTAIA